MTQTPQCPDCGGKLGGRWGTRCYGCKPGGGQHSTGRPKTGEDRACENATCGQEFYVQRWQLERGQYKFCSRKCKYEAMRLNPIDTPRWGRRLLTEYGITYAQYLELLKEQGGKCAICYGGPSGPGKRLHVDHCHEGNKVRGLLCGKCNTAIGLLDEDATRFARAVKYIAG